MFSVTPDFKIVSVGICRKFVLFSKYFFVIEMCLEFKIRWLKLLFHMKIRLHCTTKAFTAYWLLLCSHIQTKTVQNQNEGLPNSPPKGKEYLGSVDIIRVGRVTGNKHTCIFLFGLCIPTSKLIC
jgi:hypothetical protein